MGTPLLMEGYDGLEDFNYCWVDDEDAKEMKQYPWTDDCSFDEYGNPANGRSVYCKDPESGQKLWLHREVCALHPEIFGDIEDKSVGFLNRDYRRCTKDNLFVWAAGPAQRKVARADRLRQLHEAGVDVSHLTKAFAPKPEWMERYKTVMQPTDADVARSTVDPETFVAPQEAPPGVRAIQTIEGNLVYVDADRYEELARYDWRDTGSRIIRGRGLDIKNLAREVIGCPDGLVINYLSRNYHHCWKNNLFAYEKGLANRRAARREAIARLAQNSK